MTVRVRREFVFDADPEDVWAFISDPGKRAGAISVVDEYEVGDDGTATWHVRLPIPVIRSSIAVETEEVRKEPPEYVKFVGKSRAFRVTGEHTVSGTDEGGARLVNEFVVDGRLPGVESFFERKFGEELDNLERALERELGLA
ncbi:SRPBCC family protein [Halobaculum gomorrense]|uniref:Carbon monoxide dehydrogenase subunit G n=1 Tax=Halobaculum gomorrense TaxID=43928 RepID=A0A1M5N4I9_9EURY|nr:SRPBCC family protein [Halobaculum gomorrense]SHG84352.1 Carbon monoxide dehydrogenase subunit G [Halobaculum gomorrense]